MAFVRALMFSTLLASVLLVWSSQAATVSVECDARRAACEATCKSKDAILDFKCDEQSGAISSSCACASPGSSSSSSSGDSSKPSPPPQETDFNSFSNCEEKARACQSSCSEGTCAQFKCKGDDTKSAASSADSCTCSPVDSLPNTNTPENSSTTISKPFQGTVIAPITGVPDPQQTGLPTTTAGTERSSTTVVDASYSTEIWKVLTGSLLGAALVAVW